MTELEQVKEQVAENLNQYGYDGNAFAKEIKEISGYYNGRPSRVKLTDGTEIWLF